MFFFQEEKKAREEKRRQDREDGNETDKSADSIIEDVIEMIRWEGGRRQISGEVEGND